MKEVKNKNPKKWGRNLTPCVELNFRIDPRVALNWIAIN
jgi:hypothetical protein